MSQLPMSSIVNVSISVSPTFPARTGFGTLMLITKETGVIGVAERFRSYSDIDGVTADWGATTEVVKAATAYFSQSPKPTSFMVGMRFETAQTAELIGGSVLPAELSTFQAITSGGFTLAIDGASNELTGINLSGAADMDGVAALIETAIQTVGTGGFTAASFTHDGSKFTLTSGTTGASSTLSWTTSPTAGEDLSLIMKMLQGEGTKNDGIAGEKVSESLTAIQLKDDSWYGFMFTKEIRDDVVVLTEDSVDAAADWAEARVKVFFTVSNDELTLVAGNTTNIAYQLKAKSLKRTFVIFSSYPTQYPEASVAGRAFTVEFTLGSQAITLKFKQLPGITVETMNTTQKAALDSVNGNALISIAGNIMLAEGWVSSGVFLDEVHGLDWLQNAIQTEVFGYMYTRTAKVPYTDVGIQAIAQKVRKALAEGVTAGLLAPGTTEAGVFLAEGYIVETVPEADVSQSDKEARFYSGVSFTALGAGAIHGVTIAGTFER